MATIKVKGPHGRTAEVGQLGYGAMHLSWSPEKIDDEQAFEALKSAIDGGSTMINTSSFYGGFERPLANLELLRRFFEAFPGYAERCFLSVKGGHVGNNIFEYDAREENLRRDLTDIAKTLGPIKKMDLYQMARVDHKIPIEKTMDLYSLFIKEGHFDYIGLCECSATTIRRAAKIVPIALVELEYSPLSLDNESNGCIQACVDLQIPIAAYSPLGRGLMTRRYKTLEDVPKGDIRLYLDRFQPERFGKNNELLDKLDVISARLGITTTQLVLAWELCAVAPAVLCPMPGSRRAEGVREALAAQHIDLSKDVVVEVRKIINETQIHGSRGSDMMKPHMEGDSVPL